MENQTENLMAGQSPCGPEPSGLRPPEGSGPPPVASADGGPQAGDGSPVINEEPQATDQQSQITNQKSPIAKKKATGPCTAEGKRRVSQNARKHGLYSNASFFWDAAIALGEDPREFQRLLKGLVQARQPANTLEMVLVQDIALLIWKKSRLDRAEAAVQVCNLHKHDLERRKQFIQVGREISNTSQAEVREKGLRTSLDAPGKFEQVLSILNSLVAMTEKNDFSPNMQEFLRGLYGAEPTLRGAGLFNDCFRLEKMQPGHPEFEDTKTLFRARLAEEISDVIQEYELFLHEHVENTRAARMAATAPSHAQWAAIIRQQNALHRQLERKIRLLDEMQEKRKREEERFLDNYKASLRQNPSDTPRGGRHASNRKKILNRGNKLKNLLKTKRLTATTASKQTPFCPAKTAIKVKKGGVSLQEATGHAPSRAASGRPLARSGKADVIRRYAVRPGTRRESRGPKPGFSPPIGKGGVLTPRLQTLLIFLIPRAPRSLWKQPGRGARRTDGRETLCGRVKTPPFRSPHSGLGCDIVSYRRQRTCRIGRLGKSSRWFTAFMPSRRPWAAARLITCWSRKGSTTPACRRSLMPAGRAASACVLLPGRRWSARRVARNIKTWWRSVPLVPTTTSKLFWRIPRGPCSLSWTEWKTLPIWGPSCARRWPPVARGL